MATRRAYGGGVTPAIPRAHFSEHSAACASAFRVAFQRLRAAHRAEGTVAHRLCDNSTFDGTDHHNGGIVIERYTRPAMGALWTDEAKYGAWLEVELAVCEVLGKKGIIPEEDLRTIREKARFDPARIAAIELETRHDVVAFTTSVAEHVGEASRSFH